MIGKEIIDQFRVPVGKRVKLKKYDPAWRPGGKLKELCKEGLKDLAKEVLSENLEELAESQSLLYADDRFSLLVVLQALDAAGKDGTIKHVMSGVNPQGCQVFSFKQPSKEELDHNFLWRYMRCLPERGRIGIFNRSYYEDVLVVRVHPELLGNQLPSHKEKPGRKFWAHRYDDINAFERHLVRNGTTVLKFFLYVSKGEQKKRFLERLNNPEKHWKFSMSDLRERGFWDDYIEAYEDALEATSTDWAPWYVIPADNKWITRALVADIITSTLRDLDLQYPQMTEGHQRDLPAARRQLEQEE
jgi:PPK2 family polyphosphate:nucleotide phosphotransferase